MSLKIDKIKRDIQTTLRQTFGTVRFTERSRLRQDLHMDDSDINEFGDSLSYKYDKITPGAPSRWRTMGDVIRSCS